MNPQTHTLNDPTTDRALAHVLTRVLLVGPPGVGKSYAAREVLSHVTGKDPLQLFLNPDQMAQELLGFYAPGPDGAFAFREGILPKACRQCSPLIIEELGRAPESVQDALLGILEKPARVTLPTGEVVSGPIHIWATSNSLDGISPALLSRFDLVHHVNAPTPSLQAWLNEQTQFLGDVVTRSFADPSRAIDPRRAVLYSELLRHFSRDRAASIALGDMAESFLRAVDMATPDLEETPY